MPTLAGKVPTLKGNCDKSPLSGIQFALVLVYEVAGVSCPYSSAFEHMSTLFFFHAAFYNDFLPYC